MACPGFWLCMYSRSKDHLMDSQPETLLRIPQILMRLPISRSAWWAGVKQKKYPAGIKISPRVTVWRLRDIDLLIHTLATK